MHNCTWKAFGISGSKPLHSQMIVCYFFILVYRTFAAEAVLQNLEYDRINIDFDILDILQKKGTLDIKEYQEIKRRPTPRDRNVRLLEIVMGKGKLLDFVKVLMDSQKHFKYFVTANRGQ